MPSPNDTVLSHLAAHAFAVKYQKGTVLRHGDLSVLSFHATKVFNTFEAVQLYVTTRDSSSGSLPEELWN
jgi:dTDP-4-amino-4,6-dideoxygalactose transaminase